MALVKAPFAWSDAGSVREFEPLRDDFRAEKLFEPSTVGRPDEGMTRRHAPGAIRSETRTRRLLGGRGSGWASIFAASVE
jgi:hypothetical protein